MGVKVIHTKYGEGIPRNFTGCVMWRGGDREWRENDELHKEDGPAVVRQSTGIFQFWLHGEEKTEEAVELYYMLKYKKPWSGTWWRKNKNR